MEGDYFLKMNSAVVKILSNVQASGERPLRSTHGKGGAHAQLAAVAECIRPDLNQGAKHSKTKEIPNNVPVNFMAPPEKKRQGVFCRFSLHIVY